MALGSTHCISVVLKEETPPFRPVEADQLSQGHHIEAQVMFGTIHRWTL